VSELAADPRRDLAIKRIQEKRSFWVHAFTYLVVNAMIAVVWLAMGFSFYWPIFVIAGWGMGLAIHGFNVYRGNSYTEAQVQRELKRLPDDIRGQL